jgi:hypothetical protein
MAERRVTGRAGEIPQGTSSGRARRQARPRAKQTAGYVRRCASDAFSDLGSIPSASTCFLGKFGPSGPRLHNVSKTERFFGLVPAIEKPDCAYSGRRRKVHVTRRRHQVLVTGELLDGLGRGSPHGEVRAERVAKDVKRAGFHGELRPTFGRRNQTPEIFFVIWAPPSRGRVRSEDARAAEVRTPARRSWE